MKKVITINKLKGFFGLFAAFAMAIGVGVSLAPKAPVIKTEAALANWEKVTAVSDFVSGEKYLLTHGDNSYLIPGAYSGSNPSNGTLVLGTILESQAWTFVSTVANQWRITDGTNYIKIETNKTSGLRTQTSAPSTYFTISIVSNKVRIATSSTGNRAIARYTGGSDWRSYSSSDAQAQLDVYKYVEADPGKTLSSIAVTTQPTNKTYYDGDTFDKTGMVVTATYSTGPTENVTESVVITPSPLTAGTTSVTVSYTYGVDTKTTTVSGLTVTVPAFSTVTYAISAKNTFTTSGTAPSGSSATLVETYTQSKQMTKDNSQTVTLTGYKNVKITEITISMRSNTSDGAGNLTFSLDGGTTFTTIGSGNFNTAAWYGAWSTSYVPVLKTVNIDVTSSIILKISTTINSLYAESYKIKWEAIPQIAVSSVTVSPKAGTIYSGGTNNKTIQLGASVLPTDASDKDIEWKTSSASVATVSSSGLVTAVGPGTATITASATDDSGKSDFATITVAGKAISGIVTSGTLVKSEYIIGEPFDPTGLVFTANYNNGDSPLVINHSQLVFNPSTFSVEDTSVQVSYGGASVTIQNIVVRNIYLSGLSKSGTLAKSSYFVGQTFDPTGLSFSAVYSDSSNVALTYDDITFEPSVLTASTTSVIATYLTESVEISGITVQEVVLNSIAIKTPSTKTAFKLGEAFSHPGLTIDAVYNSGTVVKSSGFTVTGVNTMKLGAQTATITFEGKTATYGVSVTNVGASAGEYVVSPGTYNNLYTGSGNWSTTAANFNMNAATYGNFTNVRLSSTDQSTGRDWTISVGNAGNWSTHAVGANIGSNTVAQYGNNVIPTAITQIANYSSMVGSNYPLYLGMNFDVNNASRFSIELYTEKALEAYVVYSTNGGTSYQVLGGKQTTVLNTTMSEISAGGETSLGSNVRFGLLLVGASSGAANRNRIAGIAVQSYTPGSTNWVDGSFTPLQQASAFSEYVMTGVGEGATGNCVAVLNQLNAEYDAMSEPAKTEFGSNASFAAARARIAYLEAFVVSQGGGGSGKVSSPIKDNSLTATIIIGVIGLTTLAGYYFLQKKKEA